MRPGQNRRMRSRNRNNGGNSNKGPNPLTRSYESNGPDVKVRGNAQTIAEKYMQLARDAMSSGDPVGAENYYQHAEHYVRIVLAAHEQLRQQYGENYRPQRPFGLPDQDIDDDEADEAEAAIQPARRGEGEQPDIASDDEDMLIAGELPARDGAGRPVRDIGDPRPRFSDLRGEGRQQDGRQQEGRRFDRDRNERDRSDRGDRPPRGERRFDRPRENGRHDELRREDSRREEPRKDEAAGDVVAALPAFLMTPARAVPVEPARAEAPAPETMVEAVAPAAAVSLDDPPAAPAPKRRGRPPRKRDEGVAEAPGE